MINEWGQAPLILKNANVITDDGDFSFAENVVISEGKIVYIGKDDGSYKGEVFDCGGKTIVKPFCDYHCHLPGNRLYDMFGVNLCAASSMEEYAKILKEKCANMPVIRGFGWEVEAVREYFAHSKKTPLEFLDEAVSDRPAVLFSLDFHSCWCNSRALKILADNKIECGFVDGEIRGGEECILHEKVATGVFECDGLNFNANELEAAILAYQNELLSLGISRIFTLMFIGAPYYDVLDVLRRLDGAGRLLIDVDFAYTAYPDASPSAWRSDIEKSLTYRGKHLRMSAVKIYMDGVIDNHSACLEENYSDSNCRGELIWKNSRLDEVVSIADEYDLPMHIHAIGDAAVDAAVCVLSRLKKRKERRHIVAHLQLCPGETARLMAENNIVACLQPFWFYRGKEAIAVDIKRLGERAWRQYPAKSLLQAGVTVLFGSDFPASETCSPLIGLDTAIRNDASGENLSLPEALLSYHCGAYENIPMGIHAGDGANFVIVSGDMSTPSLCCIEKMYINGKAVCEKN